jgi:hypothetical protein
MMLNKKIFWLFLLLISNNVNFSQEFDSLKYRRSSLHLILIESDYYPNKEIIQDEFRKIPFPDKYNNHKIAYDSVSTAEYYVTDADRNKHGKVKKGWVRELGKVTGEFLDYQKSDEQREHDEVIIKVFKFMDENAPYIAKAIIAKWFNYNGESFNMDLIIERGFYNADMIDVNIAKNTARGFTKFGDEGELLIQNSFVVFFKFDYIKDFLIKGMDAIEAKTFLYQIDWNDEKQDNFYSEYYFDLEKFEESDDFNMTFVGEQKSGLIVNPNYDGDFEEYIRFMTVSSVNYALSRLQKKFDVFKPIVPILSEDPITAYIGMKEGLKGGEKFEVLELVQNPNSGKRKYNRVGVVTVDKTKVWDNRYNLTDKDYLKIVDDSNEKDKQKYEDVDRTYFNGKINKPTFGLYLRQIK